MENAQLVRSTHQSSAAAAPAVILLIAWKLLEEALGDPKGLKRVSSYNSVVLLISIRFFCRRWKKDGNI
jgi:hypothetical protein